MQQTLLESGQAGLTISPLDIRLSPITHNEHGQEALAPADPLRRYYLDLSQLEQTGRSEVDALLARFWSNLDRRDQRQEALQVLGLSDPVTDSEIRRRYQEQVMRHHPDRGGDTRHLQLINAAMAILQPAKA